MEWITINFLISFLLKRVGLQPAALKTPGREHVRNAEAQAPPNLLTKNLQLNTIHKRSVCTLKFEEYSLPYILFVRLDHLYYVLRMTNAWRVIILFTCKTIWFRYET